MIALKINKQNKPSTAELQILTERGKILIDNESS